MPAPIDLTVQVPARRLVARVRQPICEHLEPAVHVGLRGVEPRFRIQDVALESRPLVSGKRDLDAVVGRAFGDERLWRKQGVHRELNPAALADQALLEQCVVHVVAGIPLVAREIDGAVDVDRQVRVDLDQAAIAALVPVVTAPWLVLHVFHGKGLAVRQAHVCQRAGAALGDGPIEDARQPIGRDDKLLAVRVVALHERSAAGKQPADFIERGLIVRVGMRRRDGVVQGLRLLIEGQPGSLQHPHTCPERLELPPQVVVSQDEERIAPVGVREIGDRPNQLRGVAIDLGERPLEPLGVGFPLGGPEKRVDIVRIVLPDGQHQLHVLLSDRIHRQFLRASWRGWAIDRAGLLRRRNRGQRERRQAGRKPPVHTDPIVEEEGASTSV